MPIKFTSVTVKVVCSNPTGLENHSLFVCRIENFVPSQHSASMSKFIFADMLDNFKTGRTEPPFLFSLYEIYCTFLLFIHVHFSSLFIHIDFFSPFIYVHFSSPLTDRK